MNQNNCNKGFTLLELMIVVTIIGILAAIAIPGFRNYLEKSKTTEAKVNLNAIGKGAVGWFETEHILGDGLTSFSRQYPGTGGSVVGYGTPASSNYGIKTSAKIAAKDIENANAEDPKDVWNKLNFRLVGAIYYYYAYNSNGVMLTLDKDVNLRKSYFGASASASLSAEKDSTFCMYGYDDGSLSPIVSAESGVTDCVPNTVTVPTRKP